MSEQRITVALDAVIAAISSDDPIVLTVGGAGPPAVPSGPLDPAADATLELALRRYILDQAGMEVGYVEQLYTFGDLDRGRKASPGRNLSIAYLALVREGRTGPGAGWTGWYELLPWEDHRRGRPPQIDAELIPALRSWADGSKALGAERHRRISVTFGVPPTPWDGIRVLDRYELLYEAGIVDEAGQRPDSTTASQLRSGTPMVLDHRRIVATALGRLRGKLTYRPVVFELLPDTFTLSNLQTTVEALAGIPLHTQNFRRLVERAGLVEGTGDRAATGGRPAELFRFRSEVQLERPRPGLGIPYR